MSKKRKRAPEPAPDLTPNVLYQVPSFTPGTVELFAATLLEIGMQQCVRCHTGRAVPVIYVDRRRLAGGQLCRPCVDQLHDMRDDLARIESLGWPV